MRLKQPDVVLNRLARKVKEHWGVPIGMTIAQSGLESGGGRHVIGNAYFGIKDKSPSGESTTFGTSEFIDGKRIAIHDAFRVALAGTGMPGTGT